MVFRIDVENLSGKEGSIETQNITYVDPLNQIREGVLKFPSLNKSDQELLEEGSKITIYRGGNQALYGEVTTLERFNGGAVKVNVAGKEITMARENGDYASSPWSATVGHTIFSSIISEASEWSTGTVNTAAAIDFRLEKSDSILNGIGDLIGKVSKDIQFDDSNTSSLKVDFLTHRGSTTSVATLNDGIEISDISYRRTYPNGNFVIVYGSSEGETEIKSQSSSGQDATSQSTYGVIVKSIVDPTISTVAEANAKADILVAKFKDPIKVYMFKVHDLSLDITTGDVITINSDELGLNDEEVRVTAVERGLRNNKEFFSLEVVNKEFSETLIKVGQEQMELAKRVRDNSSYNQYSREYSNQTGDSFLGTIFKVSGSAGNYAEFDISGGGTIFNVEGISSGISPTGTFGSGGLYLEADGGALEFFSTNNIQVFNDLQMNGHDIFDVDDIFGTGDGNIDMSVGATGVFIDPGATGLITLAEDVEVLDNLEVGLDLLVVDDLDVLGTKNASVETNDGRFIRFSAIESGDIWFEEKTSGELVDGICEILLPEQFISCTTVNEDYPLHVNICATSEGNFWVDKLFDKIIVHGSGSTFDVTISAKRKDKQDIRYSESTEKITTKLGNIEKMRNYKKDIPAKKQRQLIKVIEARKAKLENFVKKIKARKVKPKNEQKKSDLIDKINSEINK